MPAPSHGGNAEQVSAMPAASPSHGGNAGALARDQQAGALCAAAPSHGGNAGALARDQQAGAICAAPSQPSPEDVRAFHEQFQRQPLDPTVRYPFTLC